MPRELPHNQEAEQALLGSMLLSNETSNDILTKCEKEDFYDPRHQIIFEAMRNLQLEAKPIEPVTVLDYLKDHGQLDKVGGPDYILTLSESVATIAHSDYYLSIIHEKAILRKIIRETTRIAEEAYGNVNDVSDFIDETEKTVLAISRDRKAGEFKTVKSITNSVSQRLIEIQKHGGGITGVETGYREFDRRTSGLQDGDLVILAARPAMGKTALALNIAYNAASSHNPNKEDYPVAVFSLEMPAEQLLTRIISMVGSIEGGDLKNGNILKTDANKYYAAIDTVNKANLFVDDTAGIKLNDIVAKARKLKTEHEGLKLIVIDYLQLITTNSRSGDNRQQEVSEISRSLKALARELSVPVIALSQLSRSVEQRPNKKPMMSDLRESGSIEQDADIVTFIYRDDYYNKPEDDSNSNISPTDIIIAKHRNGETGDFQLVFEKNFSRFANPAYTNENNFANKDVRQ
ncbi:MAG: replicative DNA helicase [Thomasclavelia sp.]|jgi:replicative DNA helicase|nr:replicative DNA helicase [Thomasclavelia sp.]